MTAPKNVLRLFITTQIFTLLFLMLMPTLIRILHDFWGKMLYVVLVLGSIALALSLRHVLKSLDKTS